LLPVSLVVLCKKTRRRTENEMKIVCIVMMVMVLFCCASSSVCAESESKAEKKQVSAAKAWLYLIDGGSYSDSWKQASVYFRGAVAERSWVASLEGVRRPLGKLVSREIEKIEEVNRLPGAPDGSYAVMNFKTDFEQKKSSTETVTFMLEKDGIWKAAGYFIK